MNRVVIIACAVALVVGCCLPSYAQQATTRAPDCLVSFSFTAAGSSGGSAGNAPFFDNRGRACNVWTLNYQSTGFSAVSIQMDESPLSTTVDATGTFIVYPSAQLYSGSLPLTTTTVSGISGFGYHPFMRVTLNSKTGTGRIYGTLLGWSQPIDVSTGGVPSAITGTVTAIQGTATNLKVAIFDSLGNSILASTDPCAGTIPTRVAISQTADTTIITASSAKTNYICGGLIVVDNSAGATETVNIIEGTGAGCVTTQTAAISGSTTEANGMKITGNGFSISRTVPGSGTNVNTCLMQVGTQRLAGFITYVQN